MVASSSSSSGKKCPGPSIKAALASLRPGINLGSFTRRAVSLDIANLIHGIPLATCRVDTSRNNPRSSQMVNIPQFGASSRTSLNSMIDYTQAHGPRTNNVDLGYIAIFSNTLSCRRLSRTGTPHPMLRNQRSFPVLPFASPQPSDARLPNPQCGQHRFLPWNSDRVSPVRAQSNHGRCHSLT